MSRTASYSLSAKIYCFLACSGIFAYMHMQGYEATRALTLSTTGTLYTAGSIDSHTAHIIIHAYTQSGMPLASFGTEGTTTASIASWAQADAAALQSDNALVVAGRANTNTHQHLMLTRYTPEGLLDTTFGKSGIMLHLSGERSIASSVVVDSDGCIIVGGFATVDGASHALLQRYSANGTLLHTELFSLGQFTTITAMAVDTHATEPSVVVAGYHKGTRSQAFLTRYHLDTLTRDATFGTHGLAHMPDSLVSRFDALAIDSSGRIVVAGLADTQSTCTRYTANGTIDTAFGDGGTIHITDMHHGTINSIACQSDGAIICCGTILSESSPSLCLVRLRADSKNIDPTFGNSGSFVLELSGSSEACSVVVDEQNNIYCAGTYNEDPILIALTPDGIIQTSFGEHGISCTAKQQPGNVTTLLERYNSGTTPHTPQALTIQRTLNTLYGNAAHVQLQNNQFTLTPGSYLITARAPATNVLGHQISLYNVTQNKVEQFGTSAHTHATHPQSSWSELTHPLTLTRATTYELRHHMQENNNTHTTLGIAANTGNPETYAQVTIIRL